MARGTSGSLKEIEEFPRRTKIFFWIIILLFLTGTILFKVLGEKTFFDAFFRTLQTLAFMFKDEATISERFLEIFLALVGVFFVWWILWSVADMLLDGNLGKYLKKKYYEIKLKEMEKHIIIAGGGRSGEEIAKILSGKKEKFVMTDINKEVVESLRKKGYIVIEGSPDQEETLINAGIKKAKKLILTTPKTEVNLMATITAKELNPNIEVYARCENPKHVSKLKKAGAKIAVVPEVIAADKMAEELGI
ncbi:MAG: NAD(P)-binding protein [Candidatus Pacearchaeota archaeon]